MQTPPFATQPDPIPGPALLAIRRALQTWQQTYLPTVSTPRVTIGLSGGADSVALLLGVHSLGWDASAVIVDHGLQSVTAEVASSAQALAQSMDIPATIVQVDIPSEHSAHSGGLEAQARQQRYQALGAATPPDSTLLIAHTRSDEVENFFLNLARGSGTASLAGIAPYIENHPVAGVAVGRPLLECTRPHTEACCQEQGVVYWEDPQNADPAFLRSSLRHNVIPVLQDYLGDTIGDNIARSAQMLRQDQDYLSSRAEQELQRLVTSQNEVELEGLLALHPAIASRVIKLWLDPLGEITSAHIAEVERLARTHRGSVAVPSPEIGGITDEAQSGQRARRVVVVKNNRLALDTELTDR